MGQKEKEAIIDSLIYANIYCSPASHLCYNFSIKKLGNFLEVTLRLLLDDYSSSRHSL